MTFRINDGPLAGREGKKVTSRQIRERLFREAEGNVAIKVTNSNETEAFEVAGRGELQLGVLIEQMRREGFELTIGRPRVLTRRNPETGDREEPMEEVLVDVDEPYSGVVVEKLSRRKGEMQRHAAVGRRQGPADVQHPDPRPDRLPRRVPDRHARHRHHEPAVRRLRSLEGHDRGPPRRRADLHRARRGGALRAVLHPGARRTLFVSPGDKVYQGMILGETARDNDLEVNPIKEKKLTNIRAAGKDDAMLLIPPRKMSLEQAIAYVEDDELVEVTPGRDPAAQAVPRPEPAQAERAQDRRGGRRLKAGRRFMTCRLPAKTCGIGP